MKSIIVLALSACLWLLSLPAHALCLTPLCTCTITTTSVVFSSYDPLSSGNVDNTSNIRVGCGGTVGLLVPFNIALSVGSGTSYTDRAMTNGSNRVAYNLYTDATRTTIWGDGSGGTGLPAGGVLLDLLGLGTPINYPIYGRIPGGQTSAVPGAYQDNLIITVTYF